MVNNRIFKLRRLNAARSKVESDSRGGIIPECDVAGVDGVPGDSTYDDRGPGDVVLSGPLVSGVGPGRRFSSREAALSWAGEKYGYDKVTYIDSGEYRWAVLVKNLRKLGS